VNKILTHSKLLASTVAIGTLLFSGCSQTVTKPVKKLKAPVVQKILTPANLKLSANLISTEIAKVEDINRYDLVINLDNIKKKSAEVDLENVGEDLLKLSDITFQDNSNHLFSLTKKCTDSIKFQKSCKLEVTFNGKEKGEYTSDIIIKSNSDGKYIGNIGKIHVIAKAIDKITGIITVGKKKETLSTAKKPMTYLDFRDGSLTQYIEVKNNGLEDIALNGFDLVGIDKNLFKVSTECPKTLKSGVSCDVKITYKKKENHTALSYLIVKSNGSLFPSDTVRLRGKSQVSKKAPKILQLADSDNMSIKISSVNVLKNSEAFLEDTSAVKPVYYFRTMYQTEVDTKFKEYFESTIHYYFEKNGYKVTRDAHKADKILNLYPSFVVGAKRGKNPRKELIVMSKTKVNVVTKSTKNAIMNQEVAFDMNITARNFSDAYLVYAQSSDIITGFLFNLLGLEE